MFVVRLFRRTLLVVHCLLLVLWRYLWLVVVRCSLCVVRCVLCVVSAFIGCRLMRAVSCVFVVFFL